ncbi:MAG: protein kinase [Polyangia bacterium]
MARCPTCRTSFERGEQFCPLDGAPLDASDQEPRDALSGRVLGGRYRLTSRLGQGGMGTVYRGVHTLMDKPVAVKILRGELATDAEAVSRFHREARSASRLDHEHCIRVSDFGQSDDGLLFLAMELLEGRSLGQRLREERVSHAEAASIAYDIALALEHAHEAGVIHRDLKPDNVFLARRARGREIVKVLDFGLAKLASDSGKSHSITRDGTVFGTPEYMAPEQAQGEPLDARTDLYSLGVLLYRMTTGVLPFRGDTFVQTLTKHVREIPKPPHELAPDIPPALETIILRCLEKRPKDRYASAGAVAEALLPLVQRGEATGPTSTATPVSVVGSRDKRTVPGKVGALEPTGQEAIVEPSIYDSELQPARSNAGVWIAVATFIVLAAGALGVSRLRQRSAVAETPSAPRALLTDVDELIATGQLDAAATRLTALHHDGETPRLERLTAEVAEKRGHRLEALAHMHRAKTLAPEDPVIRQALASLLSRLGNDAACTEARTAQRLASAHSDPATLAQSQLLLGRAPCSSSP